jgi:hypothetical protein
MLSKQWTRNSTRSYWVSGLCPSSRILNTRKYNVLETWSLSIFVIHHRQNPLDSTRSSKVNFIFATRHNGIYSDHCDRLCGLVRVPGYRSRGPGFDSRRDFVRSSGSGTGSTWPREYNRGATWKKKQRLRSKKLRIRLWEIHCPDYMTPLCPQKLALISPTSGSHSVGWRTRVTEFVCS